MEKRHEYYVVVSGEGNYSGNTTFRTLQAFLKKPITIADIEKIKEAADEKDDNYAWNVTFFSPLSVIEGTFHYSVNYKRYSIDNDETRGQASLFLDHLITDRSKAKDYELLASFLATDDGYNSEFVVTSHTLLSQSAASLRT
jgi:hypothetical protein